MVPLHVCRVQQKAIKKDTISMYILYLVFLVCFFLFGQLAWLSTLLFIHSIIIIITDESDVQTVFCYQHA